MIDIAIIGGGASGLIAAIQAKKLNGRLRVAVLEKMNRTGKKLMATGNGRCNLTNLDASPDRYHGDASFMQTAMRLHPPANVIAHFRSIGVECAEEEENKVYPASGQASSVLDCLRLTLHSLGCEELADCEVAGIERYRDGFRLSIKGNTPLSARKVIVATGGLTAPNLGGSTSGYKLLASLGHTIFPCYPALVQLRTPVEPIRALKGLKIVGDVSIAVEGKTARTERGEVLFTEYGVSGPPILQLSRVASVALAKKRTVELILSVLDSPYSEVLSKLNGRRSSFPERALENFLTGYVNKRIGQTWIKAANLAPLDRPCGSLTDKELASLAALLTCRALPVTGTQSFQHAQVTAGGADTKAFCRDTLESRIVPGLYAAGETLNVDGDCGGFNLQWAWASGLLAAESAASALIQEGIQ